MSSPKSGESTGVTKKKKYQAYIFTIFVSYRLIIVEYFSFLSLYSEASSNVLSLLYLYIFQFVRIYRLVDCTPFNPFHYLQDVLYDFIIIIPIG